MAEQKKEVKLVDFSEALRAMKKGYRAYRKIWDEHGVHTTIDFVPASDDTLEYFRAHLWIGKTVNGWAHTDSDLAAEDWIIEE